MFQGTVRALAALVAALFATTPLPPHNPLELFKVHNAALDLHPSITLNVNTTHIDDAAAWVSVAWRGVDLPSFDDFLALYPDGADVSATSPIKFKLAASDADHFSSGSGTALFRVLNMRHPVRFAFIRGGLQHPRVSAWSQALHPLRPNLPMAGRLTLTGRPGEVAVQWTTRDRGTAPQVQWGTQPGDYTFSADATITTYTREEMCGAPANGTGWFDPGKFHYAVMTGLDPGKRYYYRFGDPGEAVSGGAGGEEGDWSQEESFMGPKVGTGAGTSVRILAVADMGQAEVDGSLEVTQMQASLKTTPRLEAELQAHDYDLLVSERRQRHAWVVILLPNGHDWHKSLSVETFLAIYWLRMQGLRPILYGSSLKKSASAYSLFTCSSSISHALRSTVPCSPFSDPQRRHFVRPRLRHPMGRLLGPAQQGCHSGAVHDHHRQP